MNVSLRLLFFQLALLMSLAAAAKNPDITFAWENPLVLGPGGYVRVHKLNDGRLICSYTSQGTGWAQYSNDNGLTWTERQAVLAPFIYCDDSPSEELWDPYGSARNTKVLISNPETAQLPSNHPRYPNRIFYAVNLRPQDGRSSVYPYSIAYVTSDDGGITWSQMKICFSSDRWKTDVTKGCWEPYIQPLPDGTIQIYYSDETPYFRKGDNYQNISVLESCDGGDTWSGPRVVCYTPGYRDGMPVTMLYDDKIYLCIEANNEGVRLHPQVLYSKIKNNWKKTIGASSRHRFDPFLTSLESPDFTTGAPYLIETDNYFVISYQSSENADIKQSGARVMVVQACLKSEMVKDVFRTMRCASRPIDVNPRNESVMWNSLFHLGGDEILACCQYNGKVTLVRGRIILSEN